MRRRALRTGLWGMEGKHPHEGGSMGSCVPGQTLKLGKPGLGHFEEHGLAYFQNILKIVVCVQTMLKQIPLGAAFGGALRAPPRPEEGVFFQNSLKTYPYFQNILKICQSMFFQSGPIQVFQVPGFGQGRKIPHFLQMLLPWAARLVRRCNFTNSEMSRTCGCLA